MTTSGMSDSRIGPRFSVVNLLAAEIVDQPEAALEEIRGIEEALVVE